MWIEIMKNCSALVNMTVTPYAGVWIEIKHVIIIKLSNSVTPYAGVWIEICGKITLP